ncbi:MAG: hypothetical protein AAJB65_00095 [Candidatus Hodgkinia cicadicola]
MAEPFDLFELNTLTSSMSHLAISECFISLFIIWISFLIVCEGTGSAQLYELGSQLAVKLCANLLATLSFVAGFIVWILLDCQSQTGVCFLLKTHHAVNAEIMPFAADLICLVFSSLVLLAAIVLLLYILSPP